MTSLWQFIPAHILEQIIDNASFVRRVTSHRLDTTSTQLTARLFPFLGVCRDWRSVALTLMYQEVTGAFDGGNHGTPVPISFFPSLYYAVHNSAETLVKVVRLNASLSEIVTGKAASLLRYGQLRSSIFTNTLKIIITLKCGSGSTGRLATAEVEANIQDFAANLSRMFPTRRRLVIYINMPLSAYHFSRIARIIGSLSVGLQRLYVEDFAKVSRIVVLPVISGLEHISLKCGILGGRHSELVRRNNNTLRYICLHDATSQNVHDIVCNPNNDLVVYLSAQRLEIVMSTTLRGAPFDPPQRNPFPHLTHFSCRHAYPFTSLRFLINLKLLESLHLYIDDGIRRMVRRSGLLGKNCFPRLQNICLEGGYFGRRFSTSPHLPLLPQIALGLSDNIGRAKWGFQWVFFELDTLRALEENTHLANLRVLEMPDNLFTYDKIAYVIALFPSLTTCTCTLANEMPGYHQNLKSDVIDYLQVSVGSNLCGSKLQTLHLIIQNHIPVPQVIERVFILAILIPSLRCVKIPWNYGRQTFEQSVAKVMRRKTFKVHSDRLLRLVISPEV